jgi:hypothetical protein
MPARRETLKGARVSATPDSVNRTAYPVCLSVNLDFSVDF